MNLELANRQANEQNAVVVSQNQSANQAESRIERCEFEQLLQRAMEILNARDLKAQLKSAA